jgi:hypothetical protein
MLQIVPLPVALIVRALGFDYRGTQKLVVAAVSVRNARGLASRAPTHPGRSRYARNQLSRPSGSAVGAR